MERDGLEATFRGTVVPWRGPAPYHFVALPPELAAAVRALAPLVSYGWGVVPVRARIGATAFSTSLVPRDGGYLLPIRDAVRRAERLVAGDPVEVTLLVGG